jgi:hypothetical protein
MYERTMPANLQIADMARSYTGGHSRRCAGMTNSY